MRQKNQGRSLLMFYLIVFFLTFSTIATAATTTTIPGPLNYFDDFESALGNWQQESAPLDNFDWIRISGSTPTAGPSSGHTGSGYYLYAEGSKPATHQAILEFSSAINFNNYTKPQISFWYYKPSKGDLFLESYYNGSWSVVWEKTVVESAEWKNVDNFDLSSLKTIQSGKLRFRAVIDTDSPDICIDDISFGETQPTNLDYYDDFETGAGNWNLTGPGGSTNFGWTRISGATPTLFTGPPSGNNGSGYYVYTEAANTSNIIYRTAILQLTPTINFDAYNYETIEFYYHMYGDDMGDLFLEYAGSDNNWRYLWGEIGLYYNYDWAKASVDLSAITGDAVKIRFRGITGNGDLSDMALDDIRIFEATTTTTTTTTTTIQETTTTTIAGTTPTTTLPTRPTTTTTTTTTTIPETTTTTTTTIPETTTTTTTTIPETTTTTTTITETTTTTTIIPETTTTTTIPELTDVIITKDGNRLRIPRDSADRDRIGLEISGGLAAIKGASQATQSLSVVSPVKQFDKPVSLTMRITATAPNPRFFAYDYAKAKWLPRDLEIESQTAGEITVKLSGPVTTALFNVEDSLAPAVKSFQANGADIKTGSLIGSKPLVSLTIDEDFGLDPDSASLVIDNTKVLSLADSARAARVSGVRTLGQTATYSISYQFYARDELSAGSHTIAIRLADEVGNQSEYPATVQVLAGEAAGLIVYPNPYSLADTQDFIFAGSLLQNGSGTVKILDVTGRLVWTKAYDHVVNVNWSATDAGGKKVPAGVYFYLVTSTAGEKQKGKIAITN